MELKAWEGVVGESAHQPFATFNEPSNKNPS